MHRLSYMLHGHIAVPVPMHRWELQDISVRRVAEDHIGDLYVSTVFLGLDHHHGLDSDRPLLFETMVCRGEESTDCQERYTTWEEAEVGHRQIVEALMSRGTSTDMSEESSE